MELLYCYLDDFDFRPLNVDFIQARLDQLENSRLNVDDQIDELEELLDEFPDTNISDLDWQQFFTDGQLKHILYFQEKSGVSEEEALSCLFESPNRAVAYFILGKDAEKTGYQEQHQYNALTSSCFYNESSWFNLPNGGKNALYLGNNGSIVDKSTSNRSRKSLDFIGSVFLPWFEDPYYASEIQVAIAAKYTQGSGGSQNNQADDLESFAEFAAPRGFGNNLTILLTDGDYYTNNSRALYQNQNYDDYIYDKYPGLNLIVTNSAMFDIAIAKFLQELMLEEIDNNTNFTTYFCPDNGLTFLYDPDYEDLYDVQEYAIDYPG